MWIVARAISVLILLKVTIGIAGRLLAGVGVHVSRIRPVIVRIAVRVGSIVSLHLSSVFARLRIDP